MAQMSVGILSYAQAQTLFINAADRKPRPNGVKIGHNTYLECKVDPLNVHRNAYAIRYHNTDIVTIHSDDTYTLNSGGWRTVTTRERLATLAPGNVYQSGFVWRIGPDVNGVNFYDGMRVDRNGREV